MHPTMAVRGPRGAEVQQVGCGVQAGARCLAFLVLGQFWFINTPVAWGSVHIPWCEPGLGLVWGPSEERVLTAALGVSVCSAVQWASAGLPRPLAVDRTEPGVCSHSPCISATSDLPLTVGPVRLSACPPPPLQDTPAQLPGGFPETAPVPSFRGSVRPCAHPQPPTLLS